MFRVTAQKGIRYKVHTLHCGYIVDHVHFKRKRLDAQFYTDHLLAKTKFWKRTQERVFILLEISQWCIHSQSVQK